MNARLESLALQLFDLGAAKLAPPNEPGWRLKRHDDHPHDPLSPIYFNLRTPENPKPGPLTAEILQTIGCQLYAQARHLTYDLVISVPNAGDPLATALVEATPYQKIDWRPPLVTLEKWSDNTRRIAGNRAVGLPPRRALMVDDLITGAESKFETMLQAQQNGLTVSDCLVLINREQGGEFLLAAKGVKLHSVFAVTEMLRLYLDRGRINRPTFERVHEYLSIVRVA